MARSLNGLIHHLLDQIALCGEQGALPSDFISHVKGYYAQSDDDTETVNDRNRTVTPQPTAPNVDRPFLERSWKWLLQNPEIHLGNRAGQKFKFLTLSETEARNATVKRAKESDAALAHLNDGVAATTTEGLDPQGPQFSQISETAGTISEIATVSSGQCNLKTQISGVESHAGTLERVSGTLASSPGAQREQSSQPTNKHGKRNMAGELPNSTPSTIRLYTTENRMWQTLAGHGPDSKKIKSLDFACLSIIAARGPNGIYQHDLVKASGQDKRSLPARTDRLHEDGYIEKRRVVVQLYNPKRLLNTSHLVLKRFVGEALKRSTEHAIAAESIDINSNRKKKKKKEQKKDNDEDQHRQPNVSQDPSAEELSKPEAQGQPVARPLPQWVPDRNLSNQIHNLIAESGTQGMTMRDIRENLLGEFVRKPIDEYVTRLTDCWQMSQPLDLRHLSIVRDTKLRGKTTVYIYYTFENFKNLVENGTAFWEAVTTVPYGVTNEVNFAASLNAKPELDEYGFPVLDPRLFHGQPNVATLGECVSALKLNGFRVSRHDTAFERQAGSTRGTTTRYSIILSTNCRADTRDEPSSTPPRDNGRQGARLPASKPSAPKQQRPKDLFVRPRGRPRKYPKTDGPLDIDISDPQLVARLQLSQVRAERYARTKVEKEISYRIEEGGDAKAVVHEVLAEVEASRALGGQGPLSGHSRDVILDNFLGDPEPETINGKSRSRRKRDSYWPSMAAHTILVPYQSRQTIMGNQPFPKSKQKEYVSGNRKRRLSAHSGEPDPETAITPSTKKHRGRPRIARQTADIRYLPSVAAHSWPYIPLPSLGIMALQGKAKIKHHQPGRPKGRAPPLSKNEKSTRPDYRYLPSTSAHSSAFLAPLLQPAAASMRRKRTLKVTLKLPVRFCGSARFPESPSVSHAMRYLPSIAAHASSFLPPAVPLPPLYGKTTKTPDPFEKHVGTPLTLRSHMAGSHTLQEPETQQSLHGTPPLAPSTHPEGRYPGWINYMSKHYEAQLNATPRPHDGVFAGETRIRRKRLCEPADYRPRYFKVVVFKCARLQDLEWFRRDSESPNQAKSALIQAQRLDQSPAQPSVNQDPVQTVAAPTTNATSQLLPLVDKPSNQPHLPPQSSSMRPLEIDFRSCDGAFQSPANAMKRKRDGSDDLGRGEAPPNPSLRSLNREASFPAHILGGSIAAKTFDATLVLENKPPLNPEGPRLLNVQIGSSSFVESSDTSATKALPSIVGTSDVAAEDITPPVSELAPHATEKAAHEVDKMPSMPKTRSVPGIDNHVSAASVAEEHTMSRAPPVEDTTVHIDGVPSPIANIVESNISAGERQATSLDHRPVQTPSLPFINETHENVSQERTNQNSILPNVGTVQSKGKDGTNISIHSPPDYSVPHPNDPGMREPQEKDGEETLAPMIRPPERRTERRPLSDQTSFARMNRKGGSLAMMRRNIVMDVVEKCEGVIGGNKEMTKPFAMEWTRRGLDGTPDEATIRNAVDALVGEGRLRKSVFAFQNKQGKVVKKCMLTLPGVDVAGPKVKDFQTSTMAYHPRYFYPSSLMLEDSADTNVLRVVCGKNRTAEATLAAMKAQERVQVQQDDQQVVDTEPQTESGVAGQSFDMTSGSIRRVPYVDYTPPSHRKPLPARKRPKKVRNPPDRMAPRPLLPLPASSQANAPWDLAWLPPEYAFSEDNYEEERPTILEPSVRQEPRRLHARYGSLLNPPQPARRMDPGTAYTSDQSSLMPSGPLEYVSPYAGDASQEHTDQPVRKLRRLLPMPGKIRPRSLSSAELPESLPPEYFVEEAIAPQLGQKGLLVNFMDAIHYFHQNTGTFSVGFSGLRPPRQINKNFGTCSKAYSLGPRRFHPEFPIPRGPRNVLPKRPLDAEDTQFEKEVDAVLQRELETEGLQDIRFGSLSFVNHTFTHGHITAEAVDAKMDLMKEVLVSSDKGRCYSRKLPSLSEARAKAENSIFSTGKRKVSAAAAEALKRIERGAPLKRRRLTSLVENTSQEKTSATLPLDEDSRPAKLRRIRGTRNARSLGKGGEMRLLTAVMVIRTLTGGLERQIDWVLVAKIFEPHEPHVNQMSIHRCWNYVRQRHKLMLPKMESDFQDHFAKAYEEGSIPPLDFDNLADYDWKWLTEWAIDKLDTANKSLPDLPGVREVFDDLYTLTDTSELDISEYYGLNGPPQPVASRARLINSRAWVCPTDQNQRSNPSQDQSQLDIAKTWIRANVITPEDTYNSDIARAKLAAIPNDIVEDALKQLLIDKVLAQENRGRLIPGRNYDISEPFLARLKKPLLPNHFHRAARFKAQLDREFSSDQEENPVMYSPNADDGDILAIINLLAHKRITLSPVDVPANKWGHTDGGYETRHMDKRRLDFQIQLRPSSAFVSGNPLLPLPPPPSQHLDEPTSMAKIPLWYDINDAFVPIMWEMLLAAVMAVLAHRPGVGAEGIERVLRPMVGAWEVQLVLEWMLEAKAAVKVGDGGYAVEEWWWLVLGGDKEVEKTVDAEKVAVAVDSGGIDDREDIGDTETDGAIGDDGDIGKEVDIGEEEVEEIEELEMKGKRLWMGMI